MTASTPITPDAQQTQQDRKRKRKAILAGGVVLGLGAAVTLAAWSDDVFANGVFNTGSFELQGATDGETFADYDGPGAADSATLAFRLDALQMAPSQTVYAPLTIATSSLTSLDGSFTLSDVSATGNYAGVLTYRIFTEATHSANCRPTDATALTALWTGGPTAKVNVTPSSNGTPLVVGKQQAADPVPGRQHLCIAVTMGDVAAPAAAGDATRTANQAAVQSAATGATPAENSTSVTWVFNGQSTDAQIAE